VAKSQNEASRCHLDRGSIKGVSPVVYKRLIIAKREGDNQARAWRALAAPWWVGHNSPSTVVGMWPSKAALLLSK